MPYAVRGGRALTRAVAATSFKICFALGGTILLADLTPARAATVERVSVGPGGVQGDRDSFAPDITPDGRFVAFSSNATNLAAGDSNGAEDVFLRDRRTGVTERVSVGQGDVQGNAASYGSAMSADGRFVVFESNATNLVLGDTNGSNDVFVRDRRSHRTKRVNVATSGAQANAPVPLISTFPAISFDGRYVVFFSYAANLVPSDTNNSSDVFLRDLATGRTERVSVGPGGAEADGSSTFPTISGDGRYVAFVSFARNLVPGGTGGVSGLYVRDRVAGTTTLVARTCSAARPRSRRTGASSRSTATTTCSSTIAAPAAPPRWTCRPPASRRTTSAIPPRWRLAAGTWASSPGPPT